MKRPHEAAAWSSLFGDASSVIVAPGTQVRAAGEPVTQALTVECGLLEVAAPGEATRWAGAGSTIGLAAALSGAPSPATVTALRHSRLTCAPIRAASTHDALSLADIARLVQQGDRALHDVLPDPLVITALMEHCDSTLADAIVEGLTQAVQVMQGGRLRQLEALDPVEIPEQLAALEGGAGTMVYLVRGDEDAHAATLVAHADRVIVFQPEDDSTRGNSDAYAVACDGSARRHTELVYVRAERDERHRETRRLRRMPAVKRVHVLSEITPARLEWLLVDVRHDAREHESLREFEVFAGLGDADLAWLQATLDWQRVDGGSTLLQQGDDAGDAWLLRAGRLEVLRRNAAGEHHVAWLGPGAFAADAALLTGEKLRTTVRAVRDSTVARLDATVIEVLLARAPKFARAVARQLLPRASADAGAGRRARTLTVVPLASEGRVRAFVAELASACEDSGFDAAIVDAARLDAALGAGASATRRGDVGDSEIIAWLDRLERQHDTVILMCDAVVDSWTRRALRQSDHVLTVADAASEPGLRDIERELTGAVGARHLVLLHLPAITEAQGTERWLAPRPSHTYHHVREGNRDDMGRLARRLTGRAVAVAFSGASSRAPAHLGVVRAMDEHGLPVDIVSGSSSGAGVAALIAAGLRGDEGLAHAISIITTGAPTISQFQPPITALTSGAAADRSLQAVFGDRRLEDQLIPAVLVAVDIRRHRAVHLTRGPLWKLVRASGSLPLLWPPVWHEGDLLVDGGIVSYLPVEVFGDQADGGIIIASNLDETAGRGAPAFEGALDYGTVLNSWREIGRRIGGARSPRPPAITDILFHSMGIPSFQQQEGLAALAERDNVCVLTPTLGSFGLFEVNAETGRLLEQRACEHARSELARVAAQWRGRQEWRVVRPTA